MNKIYSFWLLMLLSISISAQSLTIQINSGAQITDISLEDAIAASGIALGDIVQLDVIDGDFTTNDWVYLDDYSDDIYQISQFRIDDNINSVEPIHYLSSGSYLFNRNTIQDVYIAKLDVLAENTFYNYANLKSVELPHTTTLGTKCFYGTKSVADVIIPEVTIIEDDAFRGCSSIQRIAIPKINEIGARAFRACIFMNMIELGATPPTLLDGETIFEYTPVHKTIKFVDPNGVPLTGSDWATAEQSYDDITINNNVANDDLWYGWKTVATSQNLSLNISNGSGNNTSVSGAGLEDAIQQSSVALTDIVTLEVDAGEFLISDWYYLADNYYLFDQMTDFTITNDITFVENMPGLPNGWSYFDNALENLSIAKMEAIGGRSFKYHLGIKVVNLPDTKIINNETFYTCVSLEDVTMPQVMDVKQEAFYNCTALTDVDFPKLTEVGNGSFYNCSNMTVFTAPLLSNIGSDAFGNASSLTEIKLGSTPPTVANSSAFDGTPATREVILVDASGVELSGSDWTTAAAAYDDVLANGNVAGDDLWYGWILEENLSTAEVNLNKKISVYPNPASDVVYVDVINNEIQQITLYDTLGRMVGTSKNNKISITSLSKGLYLVKIHLKNGKTISKKVLKN